MHYPSQVVIKEVSPRDGLQNETAAIASDLKIELINRLSQTGLRHIEVTSFVSPKKIPQLSDHLEVFQGITKNPKVNYTALVPNLIGLQRAEQAGVHEIAVFTAASESFCQRNINCSIDESISRFSEIIAQRPNQAVRGYISCVMGCPYEGDINPKHVIKLCERLFELGCYEVSLGDTIGVGTPRQAYDLFNRVAKQFGADKIAGHFHNTYGQALANILAVLQCDITTFDSSVAGLGGCPYARGATGNVATEDVVYLLEGCGVATGIDLAKLLSVSEFVAQRLNIAPRSFLYAAKAAQ